MLQKLQIFGMPQTCQASPYLQLLCIFPSDRNAYLPFNLPSKILFIFENLYRHYLPQEAFPDHPSLSLEWILLFSFNFHIHSWYHVHHSVGPCFMYVAQFSEDKPPSASFPNLWFLGQSLENNKHLENVWVPEMTTHSPARQTSGKCSPPELVCALAAPCHSPVHFFTAVGR